MATVTENKIERLSDSSILKKGDKWSRQSYGQVIQRGFGKVEVQNENGDTWAIDSELFEREFRVHDQFEDTVEKTKTELAEICMENPRVVMTVCFNKQVEPNDVADALREEIGDQKASDITSRTFRKMVRSLIAGEERVMVGRHTCTKDTGGRLFFHDMEASAADRTRRVDPRTIKWMIVNNIKYVLKK